MVPLTNRPTVDWRVPADEWNAFLDYVETEHDEVKGYVGREVEHAMREWIDDDEYAPVEEKVDHLVQAAGRTPEQLGQKTLVSTHPDSTNGDTTRVQCRVDAGLKNEFAAQVERETDDRVGVGLARALRVRRNGGRARRLEGKIDRVSDDAAELLSELGSEDAGSLSLRDKRTILICQRLETQFTRGELEEAIAEVAGDSPPTIRDYTEKALDHRDCVPHPENSDLFIPESEAKKIAGSIGIDYDVPAHDRLPYSELGREEKVHGLRVDLGQRAVRNGGRLGINANAVQEKVFGGHPSESHTRTLMKLAADADGFETVRAHGRKRLQVDLHDVTDHEVLEAVAEVLEDRRKHNQQGEGRS